VNKTSVYPEQGYGFLYILVGGCGVYIRI